MRKHRIKKSIAREETTESMEFKKSVAGVKKSLVGEETHKKV